jgi:hypothetical protein
MTPTRTRVLLVTAVVCALVAWLLLRPLYSTLPPLPWTGVPALLIAAAAEAWTGRDLRARILGRSSAKPALPIYVARMAVLAKATAHAAAVIAGLAAGFALYAAGSLPASIPKRDVITAGVTFAASLLLMLAALYLEHCCRVPRDPRGERDAPPPPPRPADHFH